jgi:serine/threonine-protein kinase
VPKGYEALDPNDIVPNHPGCPANLRRLDDRVEFGFFGERVYLPEGYDPESPEDLVGDPGWPRALIRRRDKARFIRIQGKVYRRGAPGAPAVDFPGNPITPHYVRVPGFYIQETEVTNGEIEGYAREHTADPDLSRWKDLIKAFRGVHPDPAGYPAVCVDYPLARKYARSVGGLLPTEAQWEWAAKSQHNEFRYAWGPEMTPQGEAARARLNDPNANVFEPAPVKSYPKDKTLDYVFDMVGNLRELCADAYVPYTALPLAGNSLRSPLVDERRPVDKIDADVKVVVRGGSFRYGEDEATAFYRWRESPLKVPDDVGFRVVIECPVDTEGSP